MACNFGLQHYKTILKTGLDNGYRFINFDQLGSVKKGEKACILRHDIDHMPEWSLNLSEIENSLGVKSTFFFQLCAMPYNLRQTENYEVVHQLKEEGHQVGLHFDLTWKKDMAWEEVASFCRKDKALFKEITEIEPCGIVSFHNPHRFKALILNATIPNMQHTYEKRFFSDIKYISDSQGWYEGCMCQLFASSEYPAFQFLTHPHIWSNRPTGDFLSDMAQMIKLKTDELTQYFISFHPACKKDEAQFRTEVLNAQRKDSSLLKSFELKK